MQQDVIAYWEEPSEASFALGDCGVEAITGPPVVTVGGQNDDFLVTLGNYGDVPVTCYFYLALMYHLEGGFFAAGMGQAGHDSQATIPGASTVAKFFVRSNLDDRPSGEYGIMACTFDDAARWEQPRAWTGPMTDTDAGNIPLDADPSNACQTIEFTLQ